MKTHENEHSIEAVFNDRQSAEDALEALVSAGIIEVTLDKINRFGLEDDIQEPVADVDKTIDSAARVMLASDPSLGAYGVEKDGVGEDEGYMLKIATGTSKLNQALKIVKKYGGEI